MNVFSLLKKSCTTTSYSFFDNVGNIYYRNKFSASVHIKCTLL